MMSGAGDQKNRNRVESALLVQAEVLLKERHPALLSLFKTISSELGKKGPLFASRVVFWYMVTRLDQRVSWQDVRDLLGSMGEESGKQDTTWQNRYKAQIMPRIRTAVAAHQRSDEESFHMQSPAELAARWDLAGSGWLLSVRPPRAIGMPRRFRWRERGPHDIVVLLVAEDLGDDGHRGLRPSEIELRFDENLPCYAPHEALHDFVQKRWAEHQKKCADMKNPKECKDLTKYRLIGFLRAFSPDDAEVGWIFRGQRAMYRHFIATNQSLSIHVPEAGKAVRDIIHFEPGSFRCECANPLGVNLNLVVQDGQRERVAIQWRNIRVSVNPEQFGPAFGGTLTVHNSDIKRNAVDLLRNVREHAKREIGIPKEWITDDNVFFYAYGVGLKGGHQALLGDVILDGVSEEQVLAVFGAANQVEADGIVFIDYTAEAVQGFLNEHPPYGTPGVDRETVPFTEVGLVYGLQARHGPGVWLFDSQ